MAYSIASEVSVPRGGSQRAEQLRSIPRVAQFRRIQYTRCPECLELAPTAAALWPPTSAARNAAQNHDAKPWQRRDPGRNLHVGCAAQTVGPRRNCRDHVRWNPHANSAMRRARRCLFLARRPQRAAGSSRQLLCAPRRRAPVRPRRAYMDSSCRPGLHKQKHPMASEDVARRPSEFHRRAQVGRRYIYI